MAKIMKEQKKERGLAALVDFLKTKKQITN